MLTLLLLLSLLAFLSLSVTATPILDLTLRIPQVVEAAPDMLTKRTNSLINNATIINNRRIAAVGSSGEYNTKVALPSTRGFVPMLNAAFVSRKGRDKTEISQAHAHNMGSSFEKWQRKLDLAFAEVNGVPAKKYVEQVTNTARNWSEKVATRTLRMTGDKIRGRGVSPIAAGYLIGLSQAASWIREGDSNPLGNPINIIKEGLTGQARSALISMFTRAGIAIIESNFSEDTFERQNTFIVTLLNSLYDDTVCDEFDITTGASDTYCLFQSVDGIFQLKILLQLTS